MKIKRITTLIFASLFVLFGLASFSVASVSAEFDPLETACEQAPDSAICKEKAATEGENPISGNDSVLMKVTNILALATSVIAVIVIIVAGFTMALSGGDSGKIQSSRNTIIYAAVGILVVALSRSIILFVINKT